MKKFIVRKYLVLFLFISLATNAQNNENKWVVGVSGSLVRFSNINRVKDWHNFQAPKIYIARYLFSGLTVDVGFTLNAIDIHPFVTNEFSYNSFDGNLRYDFNLSNNHLVPYLTVGASIVGPPSTIQNSKSSGVLNVGFGGTFWVSSHWGLNTQISYKHSPEKIYSMTAHKQLTVGVVYSLKARTRVIKSFWNKRW
jgi:predicted secreted protein